MQPLRPQSLTSRFDIFSWYEELRSSGKPIAWCSAFAPAEALLACGVIPVYPENHAAMLGALSPQRDPNNPWSRDAIATAKTAGYLGPQLCSYAQADLGTLLGAGSPIAGLPKPDLFYSCDSQCSVVGRWGEEVKIIMGKTGKQIPHYQLKAVPLRTEHYQAGQLDRFRHDLRKHLDGIGRRFGQGFDEQRLLGVVAESQRANTLWQQCLELGKQRPAPWTNSDSWQAMAPIVIARGDQRCTVFYRDLLNELQQRLDTSCSAILASASGCCGMESPSGHGKIGWLNAAPALRRHWLLQPTPTAGGLILTSNAPGKA